MDRRTAIDLFSGAGGTTAGLLLANCDVRLAVECDEDAAATYSANFPRVHLLPDRIEKYTPSYILKKARLERGALGIVSACPPCQGFSSLGNRDPEDPRNDYVLTVGTLVADLLPRALILENVRGLTGDWRSSYLEALLHSLGYGVASWVIDAVQFCAPQRRSRYVLIAVSGLADDQITDPRSEYRCSEWAPHPHTVRDVLDSLGSPDGRDQLHVSRKLPPTVLERVRAIPHDGGSRRALPESLQLGCHTRLGGRGAASVYGRMGWDQPSPTITTRCTTPACGRFLHPEEDRAITLREAAAFQTFPPTFRWKGGVMSIARQIGNAVPVRLAQVLAMHTVKLIALAEERSESA